MTVLLVRGWHSSYALLDNSHTVSEFIKVDKFCGKKINWDIGSESGLGKRQHKKKITLSQRWRKCLEEVTELGMKDESELLCVSVTHCHVTNCPAMCSVK